MILFRLVGVLLCLPGLFCLYSGGVLLYHLFFVSSGEWSKAELQMGTTTYYVDPVWIGAAMLLGGGVVVWLALLGILYDGRKHRSCEETKE